MLRQLVTDPPASSWEHSHVVSERDRITRTILHEPSVRPQRTAIWKTIQIRHGLDLPISGTPEQVIHDGPAVSQVAVVPSDYAVMKPRVAVELGEIVRTGQPLFVDRKRPEIRVVSPGSGRIVAIHRGAKRALQSIVLELYGEDAELFSRFRPHELDDLEPEVIKETLLESGLWVALRQRPFGIVPSPNTVLSSVFVTAIDTHPLAADPNIVIAERDADFRNGLRVLSKLGQKGVFLCKAPGEELPGMELDGVKTVEFSGPHPAGLPGTHIHFLDPAGRDKAVGYVNYQDVIEIGHLFTTGRLDPRRVVSLAGPSVKAPRLIRTRLGADLTELTREELDAKPSRVVSGSILGGRQSEGPFAYLGRYHLQVSALPAGGEREFFGWIAPGFRKFSVKNIFASRLLKKRRRSFSASLYGGHRALLPIGSFERVMPLDILPYFLLRALAVEDVEQAEALGCLELDEEDLALCTFVCPGKGDYGALLRRTLETIEREG